MRRAIRVTLNKIPFGLYDFLGYLASGLLIVVGMELVLGFPPILARSLTAVETAVLILSVYVAWQPSPRPQSWCWRMGW